MAYSLCAIDEAAVKRFTSITSARRRHSERAYFIGYGVLRAAFFALICGCASGGGLCPQPGYYVEVQGLRAQTVLENPGTQLPPPPTPIKPKFRLSATAITASGPFASGNYTYDGDGLSAVLALEVPISSFISVPFIVVGQPEGGGLGIGLVASRREEGLFTVRSAFLFSLQSVTGKMEYREIERYYGPNSWCADKQNTSRGVANLNDVSNVISWGFTFDLTRKLLGLRPFLGIEIGIQKFTSDFTSQLHTSSETIEVKEVWNSIAYGLHTDITADMRLALGVEELVILGHKKPQYWISLDISVPSALPIHGP